MSAEMLFLISLVLALVLGFLFKTNIGYFALTFAFVNGVFIYDMSVKKSCWTMADISIFDAVHRHGILWLRHIERDSR